jgi:diacylglycerol kinase (ATP)
VAAGFVYAGRGLWRGVKNERNFRWELFAAVLALGLGISLRVSAIELAALVLASGLVLAIELINTSVEILGDKVSRKYNEKMAVVKDVAAGAVLMAALFSLVVGGLVLGPAIVRFLTG